MADTTRHYHTMFVGITLFMVLVSTGTVASKGQGDAGTYYRSYPYYEYIGRQAAMEDRSYDYPDYEKIDYEDDPHLDKTMCNYTQASLCRDMGFTNLTAMREAGVCTATPAKIGNQDYTHHCQVSDHSQRASFCCCAFFEQQRRVNYTLLMCCKQQEVGQSDWWQYSCNNMWNTVDQLNEYDEDYNGNTASSIGLQGLCVHLVMFAATLLLSRSWNNQGHR